MSGPAGPIRASAARYGVELALSGGARAALTVRGEPPLMPGLNGFMGFKCLFDLQDNCIVHSITSLQFLEQPLKVIKVSGHDFLQKPAKH